MAFLVKVALDEQHTRGNEETSIGGSPVTIMAATDGKEGVSGDKQVFTIANLEALCLFICLVS